MLRLSWSKAESLIMKTINIVLIFIVFNTFSEILWAQHRNYVYGKVYENINDTLVPLEGAYVYWLNTTIGVMTNEKGFFRINKTPNSKKLVISFVGFKADTVEISNQDSLTVVLNNLKEIEEVKVQYKNSGIIFSKLEPIKVEKITEKELLKAACCNLSESFETNPSVDATFTDAITGTRQIQMLGLSGPYILVTRENMHEIKGLSSSFGLNYIPGPWIESILLNKGTGSVVNGYEGIAGQIDVQLKKPQRMEKIFLNSYLNEEGRLEGNLLLKKSINPDLQTGLMLHASSINFKHDNNRDGFLDIPLLKQWIGYNRWDYTSTKGWHIEFGQKGLYAENTGGQVQYQNNNNLVLDSIWGMNVINKQYAGYLKIGKTNIEQPSNSWGVQISTQLHKMNTLFGLKKYEGSQKWFYINFIKQGLIFNPNHKYRVGVSIMNDHIDEKFISQSYIKKELVPGTFFEYTYDNQNQWQVVSGIRYDYNSVYGMFITPRLHIKLNISPRTILRISAGKGTRSPSVITENITLLASSREINIISSDSTKPYGLDPEIAWNYGFNFTHEFILWNKKGILSMDLYRTDFINQVVIDLDRSPQDVFIYNLQGKSFSNSAQLQVDYEIISRFDVRLAYRWYDVRTTYLDRMLEKPLISKHRAFLNMAYETIQRWKFDFTVNYQGSKRLPNTSSNPVEYQLSNYSPGFFMLNGQVSKTWFNGLELYVGVENILNFKQPNPILAAKDPFGKYFDSSIIWGPIFGRNFYLGLRYRL